MAFSAAFITTYVLPIGRSFDLSPDRSTAFCAFFRHCWAADHHRDGAVYCMSHHCEEFWPHFCHSLSLSVHLVFCLESPLNPPHISLSSLPTSFIWEFRHLLLLLLLQIWNRTKSQPNVQSQTPKIYESTLSPETSTWGRAAPSPKIVIWDVSVVVQEIIDSAGFALYISVLHSVNFL